MAFINFRMKEISDIAPFGSEESGYSLHWFGLTDSYYWLDLNGQELFRYSDEVVNTYGETFKCQDVDYYLSRLIEDLIDILPNIMAVIPYNIFNRISSYESMDTLYEMIENWFENKCNDTDEEYDNVYFPARMLMENRKLDTGYLIGGPGIWFFRNHNDIIIRWKCGAKHEGKYNMWSSSHGEYVIDIDKFIFEIEDFIKRFCDSMDLQVSMACNKWPHNNIKIDFEQLKKENSIRKNEFNDIINKMKTNSFKTDESWEQIEVALVTIENACKGDKK